MDEKGCVIELVERETELMDTGKIRLQNINFDTGKATLKPESFQTLDVVGTLLLAVADPQDRDRRATPTTSAARR